jgi:copper chaperone CopZ
VPGVSFVIEEAGCASCADRIRDALEALGPVGKVAVDETHDTATVVMGTVIDPDAVAAALEDASAGSGHTYRLRPGSWRTE